MTVGKEEIINVMRETGVVPLFTHDNADEALQVVEAAYRGGVRAFEFTSRKLHSIAVKTSGGIQSFN